MLSAISEYGLRSNDDATKWAYCCWLKCWLCEVGFYTYCLLLHFGFVVVVGYKSGIDNDKVDYWAQETGNAFEAPSLAESDALR